MFLLEESDTNRNLTKSARRKIHRREKKAQKRRAYLEKQQTFQARRQAQLCAEKRATWEADQERQLKLLRRRRQKMAVILTRSVLEFQVTFPEFAHCDVAEARAYMLGNRHSCKSLPLDLSVAVSDYRRDLFARQFRTEPRVAEVKQLTVTQLQEAVQAVIRDFDDLYESSEGLRRCADWHPNCQRVNYRSKSGKTRKRQSVRRWKAQVLTAYFKTVGLNAIVELLSEAQIPQPFWLITMLANRREISLAA